MTSTILDRREALKLGGAASLALLAPAGNWLMPSAVASAGAGPTIVLADSRYAESMSFAGALGRQGAEVFSLGGDLAATWFDAILRRRARGFRDIAGLTLESDLFIMERLAEGSGARTHYRGSHDWRCRQGVGHLLSGSIDLDPIASALLDSGDRWPEGLGRSLLTVKDGDRNERRLELECKMNTGRGPRCFVSWLMRFTA
jgi:hypothetical protein